MLLQLFLHIVEALNVLNLRGVIHTSASIIFVAREL